MLTKIKCPKCEVEGSISLIDPVYDGPYKCWKCRELFRIRLENGILKEIEPLSEEELKKLQEVQDLKNKFRRGG